MQLLVLPLSDAILVSTVSTRISVISVYFLRSTVFLSKPLLCNVINKICSDYIDFS